MEYPVKNNIPYEEIENGALILLLLRESKTWEELCGRYAYADPAQLRLQHERVENVQNTLKVPVVPTVHCRERSNRFKRSSSSIGSNRFPGVKSKIRFERLKPQERLEPTSFRV